MTETPGEPQQPTPSLRRTRALTRASMVFERLWPLLLPLLLVLALCVSFAWFGLLRALPGNWRLGALAFSGLALLASLTPLRFFRAPRAEEVDRRVEAENGLAHSPVLVQVDRPSASGSDPFAAALWREHQKRMAARLANLSGASPRTRVPERDPLGLRAAIVLLFVTAFAFSFGPSGGRLSDGLKARASAETIPARIDAWVTPPAYTGVAPIFLSDAATGKAPITVPEGSEVALRVTGGSGAETLVMDASGGTKTVQPKAPEAADAKQPVSSVAQTTGPQPLQFIQKLEADATLTLADGLSEVRRWQFKVTPDAPPAVKWAAEPKRAANGTLELAYEIQDDYGAASGKAAFALTEPQAEDARPLYPAPELPLTLPRRGPPNAKKPPAAKASRDLTEHVWAGSPVTVVLKASDAAGQEGVSEARAIILPQRIFTNPLAKALIEQRKLLGLDANAKAEVLQLMDAVTLRPEDTFANLSHFLGVESARTRLAMAENDDELRGVVDYLWQIALGIEDGDMSDAQKRLTRAQEALKQALENGASDEEIDRLMKELRQAMADFLREFAEKAQKNPNMAQQMPQNGQELRPQDLNRMMDQIENLAKSGNKDQAEQLLSQLQEMMNNLQAGRQQQGQPGQQNSEMQQQMNKLGEIMRRQQEMMNETFRMQQGQNGESGEEGEQQQGENGEGQQPGQGGNQPMTPEELEQALKSLGEGQGKLQQDLQALQKSLQGMGLQPGQGFGEAGREMGKAEGSLGRGEGEEAVGEQGRALEALRRGAQDMMQQMQQAMQGEEGGSEEGGRQQSSDRDPLGRPRATTGPDLGNSVKVPDEIDVQRARQILEAIRKRLGNALSPQLEKEYLERLLEMR